MSEQPERAASHTTPPLDEWRSWPSAPAFTATAPQPWPQQYPPRPEYYQPDVYPPPPEFYQQRQWATPQAPAPQYAPYAPQPYPPQYGPYPGYSQQQPMPSYAPLAPYTPVAPAAVPAVPREPSLLMGLFWTLASGALSFVAYAALLGWQFGLGMIALLLVHEMGHFIVIRSKGLPAGLPIFIPMVGAFVTMRRMPKNVRDEAGIALAGPLAGTIGGLVCLLAYWQTGLAVLLPLAYFSFYLNLLNLIPVGPLDGARVTGAISKWIWPIGLVGVAVAAWYTRDILLILLVVIGAFQLFSRFGAASASAYYNISLGARIYVTLLYFGLAALLAYATYLLQPMIANGRFF